MPTYQLIAMKNSNDGLLCRRLGRVNGGLAQAKAQVKRLARNVVGSGESLAVLNEHGRIEWHL